MLSLAVFKVNKFIHFIIYIKVDKDILLVKFNFINILYLFKYYI